MQQLTRHRFAFHYVLTTISGASAFIGVGLIMLAVVLSAIFPEGSGSATGLMARLGQVLSLSGVSAAVYFYTWVDMPRRGSAWFFVDNRGRWAAWMVFVFHILTGVLFLSGLAIAVIGFYGLDNIQVGYQGLRAYFAGGVLILIKFALIKRITTMGPPEDQE